MTESQQRFLRAIAARIPVERVVEVRLFPTVRQGRVESGVAVLAVHDLPGPGDGGATDPAVVAPSAVEVAPPAGEELVEIPVVADAVPAGGGVPDAATAVTSRVAAPDLPGPAGATPAAGDAMVALAAGARATHAGRFSILTARYSEVVKGPDRGKWEFGVVHDADAPLETLEQVVRGVLRRSGDAGEPELMAGAAFQRAVTEPWWSATT